MQEGYEWLWSEPGPRELVEALKLYGTHEVLGPRNNPVIMGWADEVHTTYPGDETAWCGLGQSVTKKRAGWPYHPGGNALWARNWALWGNPAPGGVAMLWDTLVFPRGEGGHVGNYVGEDATHYHVYGFNQSDSVNIIRKPKAPLLAVRRAPWRLAQPPNIRRIFLAEGGAPTGASEA